MAHLPQGTLVAIAGGKDIANPAAVIERLDKAPREIRRHGARARRRPRRREDRGQLGGTQRRAPDRLQAGLGPPRSGRSVPPQRRPAEPPAQGRDRVPGSGITENLVDRQGRSAYRSCGRLTAGHRGPRRHPRTGRWRRGPFSRAYIGVAATPSSRALAPRSPPRFARAGAPTAAHCRSHCSRHSCKRSCGAPPALRPALPRAVCSASPAAQAPRRLRSAGSDGVEFPIAHTADQAVPTAGAALGFTPERSRLQHGACGCSPYSFGANWRHVAPDVCRNE